MGNCYYALKAMRWWVMLAVLVVSSAFPGGSVALDGENALKRISFGSCNHQEKDQTIWKAIRETRPDVWLWLGDNIYADKKLRNFPKTFIASPIDEMKEMYLKQKNEFNYAALRQEVPHLVGTWDDHDFGLDDAGKEFPLKDESQQIFLDFLDIPKDAKVRSQKGVYRSHVFGPKGQRVKLIVLDTRYHRDPIHSGGDILGDEQWRWLEQELVQSDADVNLIASSIQFMANHQATLCPVSEIKSGPCTVESWAHFPKARKRLLSIVDDNSVDGVVILSGDVHMGEILRSPAQCMLPYRLVELTSSGMTHSAEEIFPMWFLEATKLFVPNPKGLGVYFGRNFGTVDFDWGEDPSITLAVRGLDGQVMLTETVVISDLRINGTYEREKGAVCIDEEDIIWPVRCRCFIYMLTILFSTVGALLYAISRTIKEHRTVGYKSLASVKAE